MKPNLLLLVAIILFSPSFAASASAENIRVAIADNQPSVTLQSASGLIIEGGASGGGATQLTFTPGSLGSRPVRIRSSADSTRVNGKSYRGRVELRKKKNGRVLVINELDIEDYLNGVMTAEIPSDWEFEALKAQAVAARTYALYQKRTAGKRPYHILATVKSQVYNGNNGDRSKGAKAVRATRGMVLLYQGEIIPAYYHSSCGGHTENAAELWGIDAPYLKGVDCECQEILPSGLWEKRISTALVRSALLRHGYGMADILDMSIENVTPAGRVKDVAIRSRSGKKLVPAELIRDSLGTTLIPSVFFEVELSGNEAVFSGRGSGHGVGLCQWGAKEMAERGYDFQAILSHYYPGTVLKRLE